jgi:hypothetical protein
MKEFESFKVTYPPFSSVMKLVMELFLPKNVRFARYKRFGVFGLHGNFDLIMIFF